MHSKRHAHAPIAETEGGTMDNWAPFYDRFVNLLTLGKDKKARIETVTLARIEPGERVLEVGSGTGSLAIAAAQRVGADGIVAGIDPAPRMIAVARDKAARKDVQPEFRVGVIEKLPYPDNNFDVVLSSLMMHHLPDHLKFSGMQEAWRVLKPGGRLAIVDLDSTRFSLVNLIHRNRAKENLLALHLERMMVEIGFGDIDVTSMRYGSLTFMMGTKPV